MVTAEERLYWYCQLILYGYTSKEAIKILDEEIKKLENENQNKT